MTAPSRLTVGDRHDLTLELVRGVAWEHAELVIAPEALTRMDAAAAAFEEFVAARVREDPSALIYGVTSAPGDRGTVALDPDAQARRPTILWTGVSYGEPLPERVTRAVALARLANLLGGHAAVRATVAEAIAEMLNRGPLPDLPAQSNGGAGEILPLGTLFHGLSERIALTAKERMALINGSPCAAALLADAALAGRHRLDLAERVFAAVIQTTGAPREHYCADLAPLWGDVHETAALTSLRALVGKRRDGEQTHQASVSLRILPRMLGAARRAQAAIEAAAQTSLASVTDNPVFITGTERHPHGAVHSTGGYHNAQAAPMLDGLAFAHADLCQLAQRLGDHLFHNPGTAPYVGGDEWTVKPLHMAINGWAEEARATAAPTLLSLGAFGQNDVPELAFLAWRKATAIARCLDGALAGLAVLVSQSLHGQGREPAEPLRELVSGVRAIVAPVQAPRPLGPECQRLLERLTRGATGLDSPLV